MSDTRERDGYNFVNELHTCNHCQSIILEESDLTIKSEGHSTILLPYTKSEVRRAMRDGCPIFAELEKARREAWSVREQWAMVLSFFGLLTIWRQYGGVEEIKHLLRSVARQILRHQHYALEFRPSGYSALNCAYYYLWTEGSFGGRAWLENKYIDPCVGTSEAFATACEWARVCYTSHQMCRVEPANFAPTRLLKFDLDGRNSALQLIEIEEQSSDTIQWCSLSYVWGGDQLFKTTRGTLKSRLQGFHVTDVPQTIRDAITVCRNLGICHLWVDSLCIIQDSANDLTIELGKMAKVYQQAYLTISAASCKSVMEGFLHQRPFYYQHFQPTALHFQDLEGRKIRTILAEISDDNVDDPIDSRAWTYQERILSPRLLKFSSQHLEWICRTCRLAHGETFRKEFGEYIREGVPVGNRSIPLVPCIPGRDMHDWETIVENYSTKALTDKADKLVAISAIAEIYQTSNADEYLAGLWKKDLLAGLMWRIEMTNGPPSRPTKYQAPSWSWASVNCPVLYWRVRHSTRSVSSVESLEVLAVSTAPVMAAAPLAAVSHGILVVRGEFKCITWGSRSQQLPQDTVIYLDSKDNTLDDPTVSVWVIVVRTQVFGATFGLLLSLADEEAYRRVGCFAHRGDETWSKYPLEGCEIRTITIV